MSGADGQENWPSNTDRFARVFGQLAEEWPSLGRWVGLGVLILLVLLLLGWLVLHSEPAVLLFVAVVNIGLPAIAARSVGPGSHAEHGNALLKALAAWSLSKSKPAPLDILSRLGPKPNGRTAAIVADAVFAEGMNGVDQLLFLRTAAVLIGLAGTVVFFAVGIVSNGGDVPEAAKHLAGALLCTITGISWSLALGYWANRIELLRIRAEFTLQEFLVGPVLSSLGQPHEHKALDDERDLWEAVRLEVVELCALMRTNTGFFHRSSEEMAASARELAAAVKAMPTITLGGDIAELREVTSGLGGNVQVIGEALSGVLAGLETLTSRMPRAMAARLDAQDGALRGLTAQASELGRTGSALDTRAKDLVAAARDLERANAMEGDGSPRVLIPRLLDVVKKLEEAARRPIAGARVPPLEKAAVPAVDPASVEPAVMAQLQLNISGLAAAVSELDGLHRNRTEALRESVSRLREAVFSIRKAPLMRLLLIGAPKS